MSVRMPGGLNDEHPADEEVQNMVNQLHNEINTKAGKSFPNLKAISFKSQVVAGKNYFVKCDAGTEHVHVRIFKPLPHTGQGPQVHSVQHSKSKEDPIEYF